ncbi:aspartyl-tRNA synthetase 2, mitochondrial [Mortierella alpina]|nr:aspartyl-tRNA synthetase 2, mitochondrial [Mortierella alpina]
MQAIRVRHASNALRRLASAAGRSHAVPKPLLCPSRPLQRLSSRTGVRSVATTAANAEDSLKELLDGVTFGDYPSRTHKCGELGRANVGESVVLTGWAQNIRKFSDTFMFLPLRDHSGTVQLVLKGSQDNEHARRTLQDLTAESVVCIEGRVVARDQATINPKMATGDIEVEISSIQILNKTHKSLPFQPSSQALANEEVRLKHRCLDLRRDVLQKNLRSRSLAAWTIRDYLINNDFVEVETPLLFKSTPEGAREFVVPTRNSGAFYALPQSPQQYKQLLMASGVDRYFQIAKCFRDEDLRADRQPEFTQYGSDKPDTRFGLEIKHVANLTGEHILEAIVLKSDLGLSNSELKKLANLGTKTLPVVKISDKNASSWLSKLPYASEIQGQADVDSVNRNLDLQLGDTLILNSRPAFLSGGQTIMGKIRLDLASALQSKGKMELPSSLYNFLWVEGFPLFSPPENASVDSTSNRLAATHHPFTAPVAEDLHLLHQQPEKVRGQHYDLVLNGVEIGGGSIRIHSPKLQTFVFEQVLKMSPLESSRFSHLIDALSFGCPPHGGLALGFDRMMAILCETPSIRDVIAFPKSASGRDLVVGSPSALTEQQLDEYKIKVQEAS